MAHLACHDHDRRVLVIREEVPVAIHREDGTFCRGYSGFKKGDVDYKSGYDVLSGDATEPIKKRRRRKRNSSGEKLLEEIFTETGVDLTTQEVK